MDEMRSPFVGRDVELDLLLHALSQARSGRGGVVTIVGEAGVGKSRLTNEFALRATAEGALVLWCRCTNESGAPPYAAWSEALAGEGIELDLAAASPWEDGPDVSATAAARRVYESHQEAWVQLSNLAGRDGAAVVIDDAQWADSASLALLQHVVRRLTSSCLLIVVVYRPLEVPDSNALHSISREGVRFELTGLSEGAVRGLLQALTNNGPSDEFCRAIMERTAGLPLFIEEVVRESALVVPPSVRAILGERVEKLGDDATSSLQCWAVVGRVVEQSTLEAALGWPTTRTKSAVGELANARLAYIEDGSLQLAHDLLREVVLERMGADQRSRWHARVLAALDADPGPATLSRATALGFHASMALPAIDASTAFHHLVRAGVEAENIYAHSEAAKLYGSGGEIGAKAANIAPADLVQVRVREGQALARAGDTDAAKQVLDGAADRAAADGLVELEAAAAIARPPSVEGLLASFRSDAEQIARLERALRAGPNDEKLRARLKAKLAAALYWVHEGRGGALEQQMAARRRQLAIEAVEEARRTRDRATLGYCLNASLQARWGPDDLVHRHDLAEELMGLAILLGDEYLRLDAYFWSGLCALDRWDIPGFERMAAAVEEQAAALRHGLHRLSAARFQATLATIRGDFEEAEQWAGEMLERGAAAGLGEAVRGLWITTVLLIRFYQGRSTEAVGVLKAAVRQTELPPSYTVGLAFQCAAAGEREEASRLLASVSGDAFASTPRDMTWTTQTSTAMLTAARIGDEPLARTLYDRLLPYRDHAVVVGGGHATYGPTELLLGVAASDMGWPQAREHLERALAMGLTGPYRGMAAAALATAESRESGPVHIRQETPAPSVAFRGEGALWAIDSSAVVYRLRASKGLGYLVMLLQAPSRDFHVLELVAVDPTAGQDVVATRRAIENQVADPVLDATAIREFRERIAELRVEIDEAGRQNDIGRSERATLELEWISRHLATQVGPSGSRSFATSSERARTSVTKAIRSAIRTIGKHDPGLSAYLDRAVSTGIRCSYRPIPGGPEFRVS